MTAVATGGVILPGLIDLHGHPEYNVFSAWEPPKTLHQPRSVAQQQRVRRPGQEAVGAADERRHVRIGEDLDDAVRRGARRRRRCDRDPGRVAGLPQEGGGPGPQRRLVDLRRAGRPQHHRLRAPRPDRTREHPQGHLRHRGHQGPLRAPRRGAEVEPGVGATSSSTSPSRRCSAPATVVIHGTALTRDALRPARRRRRQAGLVTRSRTCASTTTRPTSRPRSTPACRSVSAPTGCPRAAPASCTS